MTSDDFRKLEHKLEDTRNKCYCIDLSPAITTGIVVGCSITAASIISPRVRKITVPVFKYALKQQMRLLAGIGVLSIATLLASFENDLYSNM
ncbi:MAG: hypothetical protein RRZ84_06025 [Romboutsia sp.]